MSAPPLFVLVAGPPATGKSTLARPLAKRLGLALLDKDAIKRALMEGLGPPADVEASRAYGRAAVMALLTVARTCPGAVLDSTFYPYTVPALRELPGRLIEIRCRASHELVLARYRDRTPSRGPGHFDEQRPEAELFGEAMVTPLGLGPLIEVDTTSEVDVARLAAEIRAL